MLTLTASIKINVVFDFEYKWASQQDNMPLHCLWIIKSHASTHTQNIYFVQLFLFSRVLFLSHSLSFRFFATSYLYNFLFFETTDERNKKKPTHTKNHNNKYMCICYAKIQFAILHGFVSHFGIAVIHQPNRFSYDWVTDEIGPVRYI